MFLSMMQPPLPMIISDTHPQDVIEMVDKLFPYFPWEYVSFDDNDDDFMLVKSHVPGTSEKGAVCVEVRTGQPLVVRPLLEHESTRW